MGTWCTDPRLDQLLQVALHSLGQGKRSADYPKEMLRPLNEYLLPFTVNYMIYNSIKTDPAPRACTLLVKGSIHQAAAMAPSVVESSE